MWGSAVQRRPTPRRPKQNVQRTYTHESCVCAQPQRIMWCRRILAAVWCILAAGSAQVGGRQQNDQSLQYTDIHLMGHLRLIQLLHRHHRVFASSFGKVGGTCTPRSGTAESTFTPPSPSYKCARIYIYPTKLHLPHQVLSTSTPPSPSYKCARCSVG